MGRLRSNEVLEKAYRVMYGGKCDTDLFNPLRKFALIMIREELICYEVIIPIVKGFFEIAKN